MTVKVFKQLTSHGLWKLILWRAAWHRFRKNVHVPDIFTRKEVLTSWVPSWPIWPISSSWIFPQEEARCHGLLPPRQPPSSTGSATEISPRSSYILSTPSMISTEHTLNTTTKVHTRTPILWTQPQRYGWINEWIYLVRLKVVTIIEAKNTKVWRPDKNNMGQTQTHEYIQTKLTVAK